MTSIAVERGIDGGVRIRVATIDVRTDAGGVFASWMPLSPDVLEAIAAVAADPLPTFCDNPEHGSGRRMRDCRHCLAEPDTKLTRHQFAEGYTVTVAGVTTRRKWYPVCALAGGIIVARRRALDIPLVPDPLEAGTAT